MKWHRKLHNKYYNSKYSFDSFGFEINSWTGVRYYKQVLLCLIKETYKFTSERFKQNKFINSCYLITTSLSVISLIMGLFNSFSWFDILNVINIVFCLYQIFKKKKIIQDVSNEDLGRINRTGDSMFNFVSTRIIPYSLTGNLRNTSASSIPDNVVAMTEQGNGVYTIIPREYMTQQQIEQFRQQYELLYSGTNSPELLIKPMENKKPVSTLKNKDEQILL